MGLYKCKFQLLNLERKMVSPVAQKGIKVSINKVSPVLFTPPIQGAKGRGVDHAKVATVMTVVRANFVWINQFSWPGKKKQCCEQRKCLEMQNNKVIKKLMLVKYV